MKRYYHVSDAEFGKMDELQAYNLARALPSFLEQEAGYMAVAMWGKKKR